MSYKDIEEDMLVSHYECKVIPEKVKSATAARDKDWITWAESQCPHGGIDSGGMICLECYQCWMERKKEVSNGK